MRSVARFLLQKRLKKVTRLAQYIRSMPVRFTFKDEKNLKIDETKLMI